MSSTTPVSQPAMKPLRRLAYHSTTTCAAQAGAYGKCIVAIYRDDVKKDACKAEFEAFGKCLREAMKRNW